MRFDNQRDNLQPKFDSNEGFSLYINIEKTVETYIVSNKWGERFQTDIQTRKLKNPNKRQTTNFSTIKTKKLKTLQHKTLSTTGGQFLFHTRHWLFYPC